MKINLKGGWTTIWETVKSTLGPVTFLATAAGVLIVVIAVLKYFWDKRRGGQGGGPGVAALAWPLVIGGLLAAPGLLIPLCLGITDALANAGVGVFQRAK